MTRHQNSQDSPCASPVRSVATGLSLVELLVALALASLVLLAVVQLFTASHATYRINEAQTRVQETGRYASQVLARAMRMARSSGCSSVAMDEYWKRLTVVANVLLDDTGKSVIGAKRALGYSAAQAKATSDPSPWLEDLSSAVQTAVKARRIRGDVLVYWGIVGDGTYVARTASPSLIQSIKLAAANDQLAKGGLALITDCSATDIFSITAVGDKKLEHGTSGNSTDALSYAYNWTGEPTGGAPLMRARVFPFDLRVFFIGCVNQETGLTVTTADTARFTSCQAGTSASVRPTLAYWSVSTGDVTSVLMDIADLHVTYDGSLDLGKTASQRVRQRLTDKAGETPVDATWVTDNHYWEQVDSIRIELLAASTQEVSNHDRKYTDIYRDTTGLDSDDVTGDRRLYQALPVTIAIRATSDWFVRYDK